MKTYTAKPADIQRSWHLIDATGLTLGRLSSQVARLLMGKHKPTYTPNQDTGDYVIVINAAKIKVSGNKMSQKTYYRHSGYPGGLKSTKLEYMMEKYPTRAVEYAVKGMIPHTRLGATMLKKLRVYADDQHPHNTQGLIDSTDKVK